MALCRDVSVLACMLGGCCGGPRLQAGAYLGVCWGAGGEFHGDVGGDLHAPRVEAASQLLTSAAQFLKYAAQFFESAAHILENSSAVFKNCSAVSGKWQRSF